MKKRLFIFDLDGTVTKEETLPLIAKAFNVEGEINALTDQTIAGNIPFVESFIQRVSILGKFDVSDVNALLSKVPLFEGVADFINTYSDQCVIATGNCSEWVSGLASRLDCECFSSSANVEDNKITKLKSILKKEDIVKRYQAQGYYVVFVGDGNNDMEAMREADVAIACGLTHYPANSIMAVADYAVFNEHTLLRLLNQINHPSEGNSVVLSCAGIGSRLGLAKTKALIEIEGKKLIHFQLEIFENVEDLRVVVGYQARSVIQAVLEKRDDVLFVYNHDYFQTKTGTSFYLGARHANEYCIAWDGDLIVHPEDVAACLDFQGEYIGCSDIVSEDTVFIKTDELGNVLSFSREQGDYEWSGPAKIKRDNIKYMSTNVFNQIEGLLPLPFLKIRAQDVDTYADYKNAIAFMKSWPQ
ncbi:HAD-IB family phosphatase [Glaciecola sp. MH2013]|uniref:HAD-IB family phosphatase n=1 Tax=Glaciecola sp. MH2013 TaxID=2785524 RepID=UPI00189DD6F4|nr:HAD-IB family phosphatase [Glaciecola sp. MH2013]MBF7073115.1 HAD-IB family phosphatase [Glaciecola sp. MH2013]